MLPGDNELQRENTQVEGTAFDDEGVGRSTRQRTVRSSYIPGNKAQTCQYQGTVNLNVFDDVKYRIFTEIDQKIVHVLVVAMIQTHRLHKGINLFGQEGKNTVQKRDSNIMTWKLTTLLTPPSYVTYEEKREAVDSLCNLVKTRS